MATALIVEDHPDQAEMVARLLRYRQLRVRSIAGTGESGLRWPERSQPDVVLLDLMLPDISGFDVCRRLRIDRETMLTPVVMLTALDDDRTGSKGFRVGANAYVTKPYGIRGPVPRHRRRPAPGGPRWSRGSSRARSTSS